MTEYIKSVEKVMAIIRSFTPEQPELSVTQLSRKLKFNKSSMSRFLATLCRGKLLERDPVTDKYRIGLMLYIQGTQYLATTDLLKAAEPFVEIINEITTEAVNVSLLDRNIAILIMRKDSKHAYRWTRPVGSVIPIHTSAMGKALLAELSAEELDEILPDEKLPKLAQKTIETKTLLKSDLAQIRRRGISIDEGGTADGIVGIGSVIREASGNARTAISISVPMFRCDGERRRAFERAVSSAADIISYHRGYIGRKPMVTSIEEYRALLKSEFTSMTREKVDKRG